MIFVKQSMVILCFVQQKASNLKKLHACLIDVLVGYFFRTNFRPSLIACIRSAISSSDNLFSGKSISRTCSHISTISQFIFFNGFDTSYPSRSPTRFARILLHCSSVSFMATSLNACNNTLYILNDKNSCDCYTRE